MGGYKKVLVALDLAGPTKRILERARQVADHDAEISVVHVLEPAYFLYGIEPGPGTLPGGFEQEILRNAQDSLTKACEPFQIDAAYRYLERGHAPTLITTLADDKGVDLIVVGSHGRHGWRLLLGSTANAVLHGARRDVLAVRV